ncbi:hypothetical protein [Cardiobacterium hominis]
MSRPFLAAALALAASHAALAADATPLDTLRAVLHSLPTATRNLDASQPVILADLGVWRTLPIRDGRHIFGLQREQENLLTQAQNGGVDSAALQAVAHFGSEAQGNETTAWFFSTPQVTQVAYDYLPSQGFKPLGQDMLANGTPGDAVWQPTAEGIPWLGDSYRVAVITHRDNILLQTYDPDAMRAARDGKESPDGVTPVTVVVDGLAQALQKAPAQPVQLALWSLSAFSYGNTMRTPLAAEGGLNSAKPVSGEPLPPYTAALFADTQAGDTPLAAISLAYGDCDSAEKAAAVITQRWRGWERAAPFKDITAAAEKTANGCAAVLTVRGSGDLVPFTLIYQAAMARDLPVISL